MNLMLYSYDANWLEKIVVRNSYVDGRQYRFGEKVLLNDVEDDKVEEIKLIEINKLYKLDDQHKHEQQRDLLVLDQEFLELQMQLFDLRESIVEDNENDDDDDAFVVVDELNS